MPEVAQTNLQLYNQLVAAGWPDTDLHRIRSAYDLAAELFAGQLRSSRKTFLAHLVGTASAVATAGGRPDLVLAALLHATYTHGEFGDGRRELAESKRAAVRAVIGAEAEALVAEYAALGYSVCTISDWQRRVRTLSPFEHDLVVLRLANEVDEHTDLGTRYSDRGGHPMSSDSAFEAMIVLGRGVDEQTLVSLMERMRDVGNGVSVPAALRSRTSESETIAPRSYRLRPAIAVPMAIRRAARPMRRRVARIPGVRRTVGVARRYLEGRRLHESP